MKILILGANGLLGTHLSKYLKKKHKVITCGRNKKVDIKLKKFDQKSISFLLNNTSPQIIINLIALTNVDECEKKPSMAKKINKNIVKNIVFAIKKIRSMNKIFFIHLSTDQVYSGKGPHNENMTNPINIYGKTKLEGEKVIDIANSCIIRTNFIGKSLTKDKKSLTDWIHSSLINKQKINTYNNIKFSPLSINSLCKYINLIIRKKICGTFNIGSKKGITKSKLANIFAEYLKLDTSSIKEINYTKKYSIAKRPLDMRLNSSFFEKKINIKTKNTLSEIKLIIKDYI